MPTLTIVPENVTTHSTNSPDEAAALVGSNVWDTDLASYSFVDAEYHTTLPAFRFSYVVGEIPAAALTTVGSRLTGITANLTAKYGDDDDAAGDQIGLTVILGNWDGGGSSFVQLTRQGSASDGTLRVDQGNTATTSYTSSTWVGVNTTTQASVETIAAALAEGFISVRTSLVPPPPFTTRAWVYTLTLDLEYEGGDIPPRRIFGRTDGKTHGAPRLFGNR